MDHDGKRKRPWFQRKISHFVLGVLSVLFLGTWLTGRIFHWEWPDAADWQAIWTFFTFLVAAIAAAVGLTELDIHQRDQRELIRPYVIVDFAFRSQLLLIEVRNIGRSPAKNIELKWNPDPRSPNDQRTEVIKRRLVDNHISFLAPGRVIQYYVAPAREYRDCESVPNELTVIAKYKDLHGHLFGEGEEMVLDLNQWQEALADRD